MKNFYLFILALNISLFTVSSQETHFSQFYTTSVYLNPALAGIQHNPKVTINYRNQWPEIQNSFITQNVTFETNISRFNNGIALNVYRDKAGDGMLTTTSFSGVYAHEIKLNKEIRLRVGMKAGFVQRNVAWDKLVFEDMIDSREGVVHSSQQKVGEAINYFDISSGLFVYSKKLYGGLSTNHLNQAQAGLINKNGNSKLQRSYNLHGGAKFQINGNSEHSFSPNVIISKQGTFTKYNLGAYIEANAFVFGLWYGSAKTMIMTFGINTKHFQIGYSYDLYPASMVGANVGSHEISYVQTFNKPKSSSKKYRTVSCPKF
tara:strand:+ start:1280 stop:2233 length:954 start_codon:yes stop_codon:yes gene_type:complete